MRPPVFIVGTGRCGSTMVSSIVRLHPRLLSLSEFFASFAGRAFTLRNPDGEQFWQLLSRLSPIAARMFAKGYTMRELLYDFGPGARFRPDNVPPIICTTLPHLTGDYEALYDELAPIVRSGGRAPLGEHYRFLFEWLCQRFDRDLVVERSGSSLLLVPALARAFPDARFVHLYRDGRDAAISMQRHPFFRLTARFAGFLTRCGLDPFRPPFIYGASRLYAPIETVAFRLFPVETWLDGPMPLETMGAHWSRLVESGVAFLAALPRERVLNLCYEDILVRPRAELARFMAFLGRDFEDATWLEGASAVPQPHASNWRQLPVEQREALTAACRPGLALLGYA
jgi:Sulfotransferase family